MVIKRPDGTSLSAIYLPNPAAHLTLWYFHGNAEDLGDIEPRLRRQHDLGVAVFAYDYPGFGLSDGRPSEKAIYECTASCLEFLRGQGVKPEQTVVYGRSLGGGPAVDLATREPVAGLILESAFTSVYRVVTRWGLLPFDQFENVRKLPNVRCPVFIIHGRDDEVIPFRHGESLLAVAPSPKSHLWVDSAGHNNIEAVAGPAYWNAIERFLAQLPAAATSNAAPP